MDAGTLPSPADDELVFLLLLLSGRDLLECKFFPLAAVLRGVRGPDAVETHFRVHRLTLGREAAVAHHLREQAGGVRLILVELRVGESVGDAPGRPALDCLRVKPGAFFDQVFRDGVDTTKCRTVQRRPALMVCGRYVIAVVDTKLHRLEDLVLLSRERAAVFARVPDVQPGSNHQRRRQLAVGDIGVSPGRQQQSHDFSVGVFGGEEEGVAPIRMSRLRCPSFMPLVVIRALMRAPFAIIFLMTSMLSIVPVGSGPGRPNPMFGRRIRTA